MFTDFRIALLFPIALTLAACGEPQPQLSFEESLQQQLIEAEPGDVIEIPAGTHELTRSLSLDVPGVTIRGEGMDRSILSFRNQLQGAEGLLVSADDFVIEDLAIEDTVGDALKINDSNNVTVRRVRTEWTGGPLTTNGAYGIYPVQSSNILIDGSVAIGASDAGIYVGQSTQIIVRNSRAEYNVAGIEIENSTFADVYDNVATNNTGGILVFDLPNLPVQGGRNTRVFNNSIVDNNTANFAPEGNIVATVPAGSGLMVLANDNIEVFGNEFANNNSANMMVVSYHITGLPIEDENYDPFPESIHVHGNSFSGGGAEPDSEPLALLQQATGQVVPDVVWDGTVLPGKTAPDVLCMRGNGDADFVNLDAPGGFAAPSFEIGPHDCIGEKLPEVSITSGP
ncbi:MAG: right-handed parallel beta-helix repeat-containing protein [Gammaproteobacteria bacterium]|nr:right-handed parallel beta-helix repeat-containing protein [Gammaproteobacteria bacterium]